MQLHTVISIFALLHLVGRNCLLVRKGGARACPVEATGMPKGITHETPPSMRRLRMAHGKQSPRRFRGRDIFVQLPCAVHPLFERLPVFRQDTVALYHIPPKHTSRQGAVGNPRRENPPTHYIIRRGGKKCDSAMRTARSVNQAVATSICLSERLRISASNATPASVTFLPERKYFSW